MADLYNTGVRKLIDDFLTEEAAKVRDYGSYWSASSAGYCMRKLIFERLGVPLVKDDDKMRLQRVFSAGTLFHEWIQRLTKESGASIAQEVELIDDGIMVKGHFDDLILADDKLILYDYKTANSKSFDYKKELSHFHKMQLGTYMYMLRKTDGVAQTEDGFRYRDINLTELSEARILILEKDTLRTREFVLEWSPQLEKEIVEYWTTLNGYWKSRKMPKCTCDKYEGGFMAKEKWNPYYYNDKPCSLEYYKEWKEKQND